MATITSSQLWTINNLLLEPFNRRQELDPSTLYADFHCLLEILRHFRVCPDAVLRSYRPPELDWLQKFGRELLELWTTMPVNEGSGLLPAEALMGRLRECVPVFDNYLFLSYQYEFDFFLVNLYIAALMMTTRGELFPLIEHIVGIHCTSCDMRQPEVQNYIYDENTWMRREPLNLVCVPSPRVAALYLQFFPFVPELSPGPIVGPAFSMFNADVEAVNMEHRHPHPIHRRTHMSENARRYG